jgi:ubiquinone/menaquinone biosynthesis C-methylase UbiE
MEKVEFVDRGSDGLLRRLPTYDRESEMDFFTGFRLWIQRDLRVAAAKRAHELVRISPTLTAGTPISEIISRFSDDPLIMAHLHHWERSQVMMFRSLQQEYHADYDRHFEELDAASRMGPGTLSLCTGLHIPAYATHEIHLMPGGYVADPFAGYYYYHSANVVFPWPGGNRQDDAQRRIAQTIPLPADRRVDRVLEQGCSSGQLCIALKARFPDAEIWGNDVAAPMLRFAHMRSVSLSVETHYLQECAERSSFPDGHFDIVTNNLLFHEVPAAVAEEIVGEAYRVLRPGGIYYPVDVYTGAAPPQDPFSRFLEWWNYRWNNERWLMEYRELDLAHVMRKVGFHVDESGPPARRGLDRNLVGQKPL